jgi:WD40 repeat protein
VLKGHHGLVTCVAIAPMGDTFATGSDDATLRIWSFAQSQ